MTTTTVSLPTGLPVLQVNSAAPILEIHIIPTQQELFQSIHAKFFAVPLSDYQEKGGLAAFHDMTLVRPSKLQSGFSKTATHQHCFISKIDVTEFTGKVLAARVTLMFHGGKSFNAQDEIEILLVTEESTFYRQRIQLPSGTQLATGTVFDQWIPLLIWES